MGINLTTHTKKLFTEMFVDYYKKVCEMYNAHKKSNK